MIRHFEYNNIEFKKHEEGWLVVKGEVTNSSGKNYHAVVFKIIMYMRNIPIGNTGLTIKGFYSGQTKIFEKQVEELKYDAVMHHKPTCQIFVESGY
jgi:hypothetical protein